MASSSEDEGEWCLYGCEDDDEASKEVVVFVPKPIESSVIFRTERVILVDGCMSGFGTSVTMIQPIHSTGIVGTGGAVWGAAPALGTILSGIDLENRTVLELGAGTGGLGLWLAKHKPQTTVILTDLFETMSNLRANISANHLERQCQAKELPFGVTLSDFQSATRIDGTIDVIVASDCQFSYLSLFVWQPFVATLASATSGTQVYLSLQERYGTTGERLEPFLDALVQLGSLVELVVSYCPASDAVVVTPPIEEEYPMRTFHLVLGANKTMATMIPCGT